MFKSATIKLTVWYLALIMGISLAFSFVLFQTSSGSIGTGLEQQRAAFRRQYQDIFGVKVLPTEFDRMQDRELGEARQRLLGNLTLANLGVLLIGGAASFVMARRTLEPIEQALEAQSRFTADASHELRTPLTAMQTEIEVALRDKNFSVAESRELLKSNLEEVVKLQELSNGLLVLASQDKEHFQPQRVGVGEVLHEAIDRTAKTASRQSITIQNTVTAVDVLGDRDSLVQLFAILLDNAIKYSPAASTIELAAQTRGSNALISVTDHGQGIAPEDLPHIFDRLYRADTSRNKQKVHGYGLGLSIAKKIVELHSGAIDVTSKLDHGSTFTVRVALAQKGAKEKAES